MEIFNDSIAVLGFPGSSDSNEGNLRSIPVLEDPLEEGKATHSSLLAWRIPWTGSLVVQLVKNPPAMRETRF